MTDQPQKRRLNVQVVVVIVALVVVLASLAVPMLTSVTVRTGMNPLVNNARQIYLAAFNMSTDGTVSSDERKGLPGDLRHASSPETRLTTVSGYLQRLVELDYLKPSDLIKISAAPGITPWDGVKPFDGDKNCAFKIYAVTAKDSAQTLFLATKNFTYNQPLDASKKPYKDKGFIVMRMAGDGVTLKPKQSQSPNVVGLLPGRKDADDRPQETPEDTLIQR